MHLHLFHSHPTLHSTLLGILLFTFTMVHIYELHVTADLPPNLESVGPTEEWEEIGAAVEVVCDSHAMPEVDFFIAYGRPWRTCTCGSEMYFKVRSLPPDSRLCFSSTEPFAHVQTLEIDFPRWAGHDYSMTYDRISTKPST